MVRTVGAGVTIASRGRAGGARHPKSGAAFPLRSGSASLFGERPSRTQRPASRAVLGLWGERLRCGFDGGVGIPAIPARSAAPGGTFDAAGRASIGSEPENCRAAGRAGRGRAASAGPRSRPRVGERFHSGRLRRDHAPGGSLQGVGVSDTLAHEKAIKIEGLDLQQTLRKPVLHPRQSGIPAVDRAGSSVPARRPARRAPGFASSIRRVRGMLRTSAQPVVSRAQSHGRGTSLSLPPGTGTAVAFHSLTGVVSTLNEERAR